MEYVLVDLYGSTLDLFEDFPTAREAVVSTLRDDPDAADELLVMAYADGRQIGPAIAASQFVAPTKSYFAQLIAGYLINWAPQIELGLPRRVDPEASIEIEWETEEPDPDAETLLQSRSPVLC
ncbi:MAG TPA: hypothetical protein VG448_14050 [Solirubrobacterales bacterium]|nr:hypothetical protein [Solirubrobacterales bacterium]